MNMLYLIVFVCLLHLSVGGIVRGRVLLDGDVNKAIHVPSGSNLIVRFQDTSLADASAIDLGETSVSNLVAFPFDYEIEIPSNLSPALSYSLSARITRGETLLFINDQHIIVAIGVDSPIIRDIPVIRVNPDPKEASEQLSWPEMLGQEGTYAVQYIKEKSGLTDVFTVLPDTPMTMDYRTDRVRVLIDANGIVIGVPRTG